MLVREGCLAQVDGERLLQVTGAASQPTIQGVEVSQIATFINERRVLVVTHNSLEPPGTLGYTVIVRPGCAVGDHYHHHREERIVLLHGRAEFRLFDERASSPSASRVNLLTLDYPGSCVRVPTGVAHAVVADGVLTVLQVLASADYDHQDDVPIPLSGLPIRL